jgi:hypothetical protein
MVGESTEECLDAWDAMAEKADQEFYHEMVKFARGEDHDIKPGSVWMIKAEIAKRLTANSPDLLADAKRPDLRRPRSRSDTRHQGPRGFEARMIFGPSALRPARPQAVHGRAREP